MGRWTEKDAAETLAIILALDATVILNDRLGVDGDTLTREGENSLPDKPLRDRPWEYCWNLGVFWGYNPRQYNEDVALIRTPEHYVETLVRVASLGGNYLLNVGPQPDGQLPPKAVEYLKTIGSWVRANGACIFGVAASPFDEKPAWGYITSGSDRLYLVVKDWPADGGALELPAKAGVRVRGASLLRWPERGPLKVAVAAERWSVAIDGAKPDEPFTVIVLDLVPTPIPARAESIRNGPTRMSPALSTLTHPQTLPTKLLVSTARFD